MQLPNCRVSVAVICIEYVLCVTSGKLYTLYNDSHTWHEVCEVCRSQGQQMLRFKTAEELSVIESVVTKWRSDDYLKRGKEKKEPRDIWIGFCDLDMDSHKVASLKRTDCTDPEQFIKLANCQNNEDGIKKCVRYTHNHKLKKEKCSEEYATVCEKETDECASIESSSVFVYKRKYCAKVADLSPSVPENSSTVGMCSDTVTNGSTSVLSSSTGTTKAAATAPAAAVLTTESVVTTSESDVTTVETESASTSEKITSAASTTTPKATAKTPAESASTPKSDVTTSESVTTVKTESAQTPDATTSSNGKTTPVMQLPENLCPNCTTTNNACVWLSSVGPSVDEIKELIKKLTLEKKTLSSYKRAKTSASDDRPTAQAIGKVGIVFFVLAFAGVVLLDCGRVVDCLRKRNRKRVIFSKA